MRAVWFCAIKELRRNLKAWVGLAVLLGVLGGGATLAVAGAARADSTSSISLR